MKLALIGLEKSGKTTVFNALTGAQKEVGTYGKIDANIAIIKVPDERIDWLSSVYKPKKTVHAGIEFIDVPGNINDSADPKVIVAARETEALVHVVRAFKNDAVPHPLNSIDPLRDSSQITTGLILADMSVISKRIERLHVSTKKPSDKQKEEKAELAVLEKVMKKLEEEKPASEAGITDDEEKSIRAFSLLTLKPHMTVLNMSEAELSSGANDKLLSQIPNSLAMSASVEMELRQLDEKDRASFMQELGVKELSLDSFIRKAYATLGLISFFTVGEDEVRAWTIKKGTIALNAAGAIHSDLERGFIRAEIFSYQDIHSMGSEQEVKKAGKFRLEGKNYVVQDGDIICIKFSV